MKGFVACWFFPPITSSEGIVTYKLLKNSENEYDVCNSTSKLWSYDAEMQVDASNIHIISVETASLDEWVEKAIAIFEERHADKPYDFIMTRSMPPESIKVGLEIKRRHPEIIWIASMGDPVANNPYEIHAYIDLCPGYSPEERIKLKEDLRNVQAECNPNSSATEKLLFSLKDLEAQAFEKADLIICPSQSQKEYMLQGKEKYAEKVLPIAHTYDLTLYPEPAPKQDDTIVFSYLGSTDAFRSLKPLLYAFNQRYALLSMDDDMLDSGAECTKKLAEKALLDRIRFCFIGNQPRGLKDTVIDFYLDEKVSFIGNVDYLTSLRYMREADCLVHVDAVYDVGMGPYPNIFFAGKLADYVGAGKPILSLTSCDSPGDKITQGCGGISVDPRDTAAIGDALINVAQMSVKGKKTLNTSEYRKRFDARHVACQFDEKIKQLVNLKAGMPNRRMWYDAVAYEKADRKLISVCIPSYNVERFLDRCLNSLIAHPLAMYLDIVVVNDGSSDNTMMIAREYEKRYANIVRVIDKENGGHGSTINIALEKAEGLYFMVVDADDWVNNDDFDILIKKIRKGEIDTDLISSNYMLIDIDSAETELWQQDYEPEYEKPLPFSAVNVEKAYFTLASTLFKTAILRRSGMRLQEKTFFVDVEYILFPIPYVQTVMFTQLNIYRYCRGNAEQSVHVPNMVKRFDNHNRVVLSVLEYYANTPMGVAQKAYLRNILVRLIRTHYALMVFYDSDLERGSKRGKEFDVYLKQKLPQVYKAIDLPFVNDARKCDFDAEKYQQLRKKYSSEPIRRKGVVGFIIRAVKKVWRSRPVRALMQTNLAKKLKQTKMMNSPIVAKLRARLNR